VDYVTLGSTGITTNKNGFGAIPIQRLDENESRTMLERAYNGGITFYDTARFYTDSEDKIGAALSSVRKNIFIATKAMASDSRVLWEHLEISLSALKTDYIDIYQFHNPPTCPKPGDGSGLYEAMLDAKAKGLIRHIGISNHRIAVAREAADSGLYEIIQYPLSYLSTAEEVDFIRSCTQKNIGIIAMKALSGGLLSDSAAAYAYLMQFPKTIPIWGIQFMHELEEFLSYQDNPPVLDEKANGAIERDRNELSGDFCRGCGYCLPCPANINIPMAARMDLFVRRTPEAFYLSEDLKATMKHIDDCIDCEHCKDHCPYNLDPRRMMKKSWAEYKELL